MAQLAQEAIDIQDGCNASGIVFSFFRAITRLREIARAEGWEGTDAINRHPISLLFSSKIASLTYSESGEEFHRAYEWAKEQAAPIESLVRTDESERRAYDTRMNDEPFR
jgi:hypothetical protein